jgi:hypothetical protein
MKEIPYDEIEKIYNELINEIVSSMKQIARGGVVEH